MDWFKKIFAEDYGDGSTGMDFLSTMDGSETHQNDIDHPNPFDLSKGEGMGQQPDNGRQNHPITPDGESFHNSDNTNQGKSEHDENSANYTTMPFSEEGVDDNHNNNLGVANAGLKFMFKQAGDVLPFAAKEKSTPQETYSILDHNYDHVPVKKFTPGCLWCKNKNNVVPMPKKARQGEEADFFTSNVTGGPADSPQILNDGHADEELQRDQQGVKSTTNNFDPSTKGDISVFKNPGVIGDKDGFVDNGPDINKGRRSASFRFFTRAYQETDYAPFDKKKITNEVEPEDPSKIFNTLQYAPHKGKHLPDADRLQPENFTDPGLISLNRLLLEKEVRALGEKVLKERKKKAEYSWGDDSNVEQIMDPDELRNDKTKKDHDYGTGDCGAGNTNMGDSPLLDDSNSDSKNYSGFSNIAALKKQALSEDKNPWLNHPDTLAGEVDLLPVKWVRQFHNNEINPEKVKKLAESIKKEGLREPIQLGIGKEDRTVTLGDGNHRTAAFDMNGMTHIPVHGYSYKKRKGGVVHDKMSRVGPDFPKYFAPRDAFDEFSDLKPPVNTKKAGLLSIIMTKADYNGEMPSANPNSGPDDEDNNQPRPTMTDGKEFNMTHNMDDKDFNDPAYYRQRHIKYGPNDRAGDDTENYYNISGSGGGTGMEGDTQNFSGIDNS